MTLDLEACATPKDVATALRRAATLYRESQAELAATWTDPKAGHVWAAVAKELEKTANNIAKKC